MEVSLRALFACLVTAVCALGSASAADEPDLIFKSSTVFKLLTPNDKLATYGVDDPAVEGVACHFTVPERGGIKGWLGVAEEVSDISLACRQIGPIKIKEKFSQGEDVFRQRRSLFFKKMQIVRGCDVKRNVLVYMVYSDRVIEGSPKNSTSTVPIMPWGAEADRCRNARTSSISRPRYSVAGKGICCTRGQRAEAVMSTTQPNAAFQRAVTTALHRHWKLYLVEGILLIILGAVAIIVPPLATLAITIVLGWLLLLSGVMGLYTSFMLRHAPGFWWSLISAALAIVVGLLLLIVAVAGRAVADAGAGRLLHRRRRRLDHVRARSQARIVRPVGLDAVQRHRRSGACRDHLRRLAGHRGLGARPSGRHQHDVRRLGAGAAGAAARKAAAA